MSFVRRDLGERLLEFAARVLEVIDGLGPTLAGRRIGDQLFRSASSAGANYQEAQAAESRADFIHKLQITLKELREASYWLRLIARGNLLPPARVTPLTSEAAELVAIVSKAVVTAKRNQLTTPARPSREQSERD